MSHLPAHTIDKPIEVVHPDNTPDASKKDYIQGLDEVVGESERNPDVSQSIHLPFHKVPSHPWLAKFIPGIEKLASTHHVGNYVIDRTTGQKIFESMPIYARLGMHLLFYGREQIKLLSLKTVEDELRAQSIREGKIYDDPQSVASIPSFIKTYDIQVSELLEPDITKYANFNAFFSRKLKPDARPVQNLDNPSAFCSAADCRLVAFNTITLAQQFWVKGKNFTIANLIDNPDKALEYEGGSVAIFRLAPQDYHRFHSPADVVVGDTHDIPGQYYTVNPQAVNEPGFDVFTANKRSVTYLKHVESGRDIAFVAIGALLVASIGWTRQKGETVRRGEELGYFAYGGSTVVAVFPKGLVNFDDDLVSNSLTGTETLMKVGYSLGVKGN